MGRERSGRTGSRRESKEIAVPEHVMNSRASPVNDFDDGICDMRWNLLAHQGVFYKRLEDLQWLF